MKLRWQFGIIAGIFLAVFALYPQFKLWYIRGGDWQGNYAYNDIDEVAYAAYVKALVDGRPRKNDPYTGRDESPEQPQPESLFSIQFAAPYTLAIPARLFGISTPWAMIVGGAAAAFLTALAIFWLLGMVIGDSLYAMAGSLAVLCGGALAAGEGAIGEIFFDGFSYPYFPGFRRYIPALAFPAFFALVGLVWKMLAASNKQSAVSGDESNESAREIEAADKTNPKSKIQNPKSGVSALLIVLSALAFGYTVFSYFYVWTTAVAWLGCLALLWLIVRPDGVWGDIKHLASLGTGCVLFLLPYAYLLSGRSTTMDEIQLLVRTHSPDFDRFPEYISIVVLVLLAAGIALKKIALRNKSTLFVLSLALAPLIVFNQQVITGQSLQPIHYQVFIGNYVAGLALVSAVGLLFRDAFLAGKRPIKIAFAGAAIISIAWGFVECHYTVRVLDDINESRDQGMPLGRRLTELAKHDPDPHHTVVLHLGIGEGDDLPTIAPQGVLWARHQHVFAGMTWQESKERYYQFLYYQGVTETQLARAMKDGDFVSMIALFGWGRHTGRLNSEYKPLTFGEIDHEAKTYSDYAARFDPRNVPETVLSYLVVPDGISPDLRSVDKWYERSQGEHLGNNTLYLLKLRTDPFPQ
jgi:hypothetical protein